MKNPENDAVS